MSCEWRQFEDSAGVSVHFLPLPPERIDEIPVRLPSTVSPEYFEYEGKYFAAGKVEGSDEWIYYILVCRSPWVWPVVAAVGLVAGVLIGRGWR